MQTRPFLTRLQREHKTFRAMLSIYCEHHHQSSTGLCSDCEELLAYAEERLERCPFQSQKPTCANCLIHCYRKEMRARTREVMRFSGPRMLFRHPFLAAAHLLDGHRKAPVLKR
jgi:hypothetical protein